VLPAKHGVHAAALADSESALAELAVASTLGTVPAGGFSLHAATTAGAHDAASDGTFAIDLDPLAPFPRRTDNNNPSC
jgi:hypothetical protein